MRIVRYYDPRTALAGRFPLLNPWHGFEEEIDRLMNQAFTGFLGGEDDSALTHPRVDLYEDKDNLYFRAEVPGLKREDVQVEMGDGVLTISGQRTHFATNGEAKRSSQFSRTVSVPTRVQDDRIAARYEDGVLTVTLPKAEEVKPKRVAIQVK